MIVRKLDSLGRITVPSEMRRVLRLKEGDGVAIFMFGKEVSFRKYSDACCFCGSKEDVKMLKKEFFCKKCIEKLTEEDTPPAS